ncbi:MAG: class I SAM-dependent methyltransferase [Mariprofundaceae bacterium]
MNSALLSFYALSLKRPFSYLGYKCRFFSRQLRGKLRDQQATTLPKISWRRVDPKKTLRLIETNKAQGNVSLAEVVILAKVAGGVQAGDQIVEIGTFDGRTTLNMAVNSPDDCPLFTLDLPQGDDTAFDVEEGEKSFIEKAVSGARFLSSDEPNAKKITQMFGDSATFDFSEHFGKAGLFFVDGSHAYDYAKIDTATAMKVIRPGGIIIWHDYGVWQGVTKALEEIEAEQHLGLNHIRGTSLVYWQSPSD